MEDKIVEIARFYEPEKAQILESLLKSEGIKCYLRNEYTSQVMYPANMGGIRIELLESEVPRAMEILEANGYELPEEGEEAEELQAVSGWARHVPPSSPPRKADHRSFHPCSRIPGPGHLFRLACFIQLNKCKLWHAERLQIVKPYASLFCGAYFVTCCLYTAKR